MRGCHEDISYAEVDQNESSWTQQHGCLPASPGHARPGAYLAYSPAERKNNEHSSDDRETRGEAHGYLEGQYDAASVCRVVDHLHDTNGCEPRSWRFTLKLATHAHGLHRDAKLGTGGGCSLL